MIDGRLVATLLRHEIRMLLRSRRTVIFSIVLPLVFLPLVLFSGQAMESRREKRLEELVYLYAVTGPEAALVRGLLAEAGVAPGGVSEVDLGERPLRLEERRPEDTAAALRRDELHFYLEAMGPDEAAALAAGETGDAEVEAEDGGAESRREASPPAEAARHGVPLVRIHFKGDRDRSDEGARRIRELLARGRESRRDAALRGRGFPADPSSAATLETEDVASEAQVTGSGLGRFLTAMLMLFLFTGAAVVATDSIAGEKERGTLETLLTTAAHRLEIVGAKLLAILSVALAIAGIQVANLLLYVGLGVVPLPEGFVLEVTAPAALVLLLLFLPVAVLVSSLLLMLSGYARSYQEAQLYFFPVILVGALPALAAMLPGIGLRSAIVLVPVANISVAVREVLVGSFDWPFLALAWGVTAAAAALSLRATVRALSVERLIGGGEAARLEHEGGPELFARRVPLWFAVVWVVLFVAAANVEALSSMPRQILFNVVFLFGGASWLMIRRYRLDPRQALALRAPRPAVWLGVLVGVPAAHLTGLGVFLLANRFIPVPQRMLEAFGRELLPSDMPLWQILVLVAVLPGIFEEIAFRGVLLHGLRRRFGPVVLCLVVGAVFGMFHYSLFRILPTFYLGVILAAVTLLTGSIFPAMAWHGLNNALALMAARLGAPLEDLDAPFYLAAVLLLAVSFWVIYRNRTPYPDLRRPRRPPPS